MPEINGQDRLCDRLAHLAFGFLIISTLANGLFYYLWNTRLIEPVVYHEYLAQLNAYLAAGQFENFQAVTHGLFSSLFEVPLEWLFTKLTKDLFFLFVLLISMMLLRRENANVILMPLWPTLLLGWILVGFALSLHQYGWIPPLLGLRPFLFLGIVFLGSWLCRDRNFSVLAVYLLLLVFVELGLAIYENFNSLGLFHSQRMGNRVTGTFTLPTSLGIFAVVALTLIQGVNRASAWIALLPVTVLVYLSGSGTGFVLLAFVVAILAFKQIPAQWRVPGLVLLAGLLLFALVQMPQLLSRPTLHDSMFGRLMVVETYLKGQHSPREIVLGHGLGIGSNVLNSAKKHFQSVEQIDMPKASADSTPMALIHQLGWTGLILFYGMIASAARRDRSARLQYAVLVLASLTINIIELFPVNFLLGLLLCRSMVMERLAMNPPQYPAGFFCCHRQASAHISTRLRSAFQPISVNALDASA